MLRALKYIPILVVVWAVGTVIYGFGFYSAARRVNIRTTGMLASTVYELAQRGAYEGMIRSKACYKDVVDQMRAMESSDGRVEEASVQSVHTGPFGLPVVVQLNVVRNGKVRRESLYRNSLNGFDGFSADPATTLK
jgi:hypothetical protein